MDDGSAYSVVFWDFQLDIYSLSRKWKELVDKARAKQLQPQEYTTGTPYFFFCKRTALVFAPHVISVECPCKLFKSFETLKASLMLLSQSEIPSYRHLHSWKQE